MTRSLRALALSLGLAFQVGVVATAALLLASYVLAGANPAPYRAAIAEAFEAGVLPTDGAIELRPNDFQECIVLGSLIAPYPSRLVAAQSMVTFDGYQCPGLLTFVEGTNTTTHLYTRYLNGWKLYYVAALQVTSVHGAFLATQVAGYALMLAGLALHLRRYLKTSASDGAGRAEQAFFLAVWLALLLAHGWEMFGAMPTYALPGIVLFATLLWLGATSPFELRSSVLYGGLALSGALTAQVDFLTGPAPLGVAALLGVLAVQMRAPRRQWPVLVSAVAAFGGAFVMAFAAKFAVGALTLGPAFAPEFVDQLAYRAQGAFLDHEVTGRLDLHWPAWRAYADTPGFGAAALAWLLWTDADRIAFGSDALGRTILVMAAAVLLYAALRTLVDRRWRTARNVVLLASALVPFMWYAVMFTHSIQHTYFMLRLLVWPVAVALFLAWLAFARNVERRQNRKTSL